MENISILISKLIFEEDINNNLEKAKYLLKNPPALCPVISYKNLSKIVAYIEFINKNNSEGIFYLISSHCFFLKKIIHNNLYSLNEKDQIIKNINFKEDIVEDLENYDNVILLLSEMPPEWTIVQLTCSYDLPGVTFSPTKPDTRPHEIHLVRMVCGEKTKKYPPFEIRLHPKLNNDKFYFWKQLEYLIKKEMKKFQDKINLLESEIKNILEFCEDLFSKYKSIFLGSLTNEKINNELLSAIQKVIQSIPNEIKKTIPEEDIRLLECLALAAPTLEGNELTSSLMEILKDKNIVSNAKKVIEKVIKKYNKETKFRRNPVILIIDQMLECIPFEMLSFLNNQPVSRGHSFLMMYQLFQVHKNTIYQGYKLIKNEGNYILSEDENLVKTKKTLKGFFDERFPDWTHLNKNKNSSKSKEIFLRALQKEEIYFYFGHGAGVDIVSLKDINKIKINSIVFLSGCSTSNNKLRGENIEGYSPAHYYQASFAPCVVGAFWPLLDYEASKFFMILITLWLDKNRRKEDDLLLAIQKSKETDMLFSYKSVYVATGLPIKLSQDF